MKRIFLLWGSLLVVLLGIAYYYLFTPGAVPAGQQSVIALSHGMMPRFASEFNAAADQIRIVAVLDPAKQEQLRDASMVQTILSAFERSRMRAYIIWQPEKSPDWTAPSTQILAHVTDPRAQQYWDYAKVTNANLGSQRIFIFSKGALWPTPTDAPKKSEIAGYAAQTLKGDFKRAVSFLYSIVDAKELPSGLILEHEDLAPKRSGEASPAPVLNLPPATPAPSGTSPAKDGSPVNNASPVSRPAAPKTPAVSTPAVPPLPNRPAVAWLRPEAALLAMVATARLR